MWRYEFIILGCILLSHSAVGLWSCSQDTDCSSLAGSFCSDGNCVCRPGQQSVLGGTLCADVAPYHTSPCFEDHQCSRLVTSFQCRRNGTEEGNCYCQPGFHYFLGRCWNSVDYGEPCARDEECMNVLRNPYSLVCNATCDCAPGYYLRQRGECRKIGHAVGDGCVLDQDCQFTNAACNITSFRCIERTSSQYTIQLEDPLTVPGQDSHQQAARTSARQQGAVCSASYPCPAPFECSSFGICICPVGYYSNVNGTACLAELGSPSTEEQCVGLFAEVRDGICTCQANFFFEENMRDCVKASRRITDSCVTDSNCFTFGAASRCGPPQQWSLRTCECIPELAVWDAGRNMCRLFAGIGESCEVDSDCLAGELEIQCVRNSAGEGICTCPEGLTAVDGLCLTTGLVLGDSCQASSECTGTSNTACSEGRCSCDSGYQELGGQCAPVLGGRCAVNSDCVIQNSVCVNSTSGLTCQCGAEYVEELDQCWPTVSGFGAECNVTSQCTGSLGDASECFNNSCRCLSSFHHRDGGCWRMTGLFEGCSRRSECYLSGMSERVTCRNSLCQCEFNYPYSEQLHTCLPSSSSVVTTSSSLLIAALIYLYSL